MESPRGMVHLYVGDGKGKTTAAAGLAMRCLGHGKRVLFAQFLKGQHSGELAGLKTLGADVLRAKSSGQFVSRMSDEERETACREHAAAFSEVRARIARGDYDLVVLDEVVGAVAMGCVSLSELLDALRERPRGMELVLTGHNPPGELLCLCDYHTEFVCKKHPYQKGVPAREGIES